MNALANKFITIALVIAMQLPAANLVLAQSSPETRTPVDTRAPVIELETVAEAPIDNSQVFTAKVFEAGLLKDVLLYYRRTGQQPFVSIPMTQVGSSDFYSATVATDTTDLRAIEYYVQARDAGGNRTVEGYAFDPYTRVLTANENIISTTPTPTSAEPESIASKIRWWHIVAGVIVVGAIASASSSGGDGGSNASDGTVTVPLTVTIPGI